jgi:hypothetical protein
MNLLPRHVLNRCLAQPLLLGRRVAPRLSRAQRPYSIASNGLTSRQPSITEETFHG